MACGSDRGAPRAASRSAGRRLRGWGGAAALGIALAAPAAAASEGPEEWQRWTPSFALFFDALGQSLEGSVETSPVAGPPLSEGGCATPQGRAGRLCVSARQNPGQILFPDSDSRDTSLAPLVGASLELMTPSPLDGWLQPRLFVHGDGALAFGFERNVAGVEGPAAFALPGGIVVEQDGDPTRQPLEELSIVGQGSRSRIQVERLVWSAGAGVAFGFRVFGRRLRVKPSFEYLRQELELSGVVHRAVALTEPEVSIIDLSDFRLISMSRRETKSYDGIGYGIEFEVDTARLGPFLSSVYLMGRSYRLLGDLDTTFSASQDFIDQASGQTVTESATWTFRPDRWVWRTGVGIRFRWLPER